MHVHVDLLWQMWEGITVLSIIGHILLSQLGSSLTAMPILCYASIMLNIFRGQINRI